MLNKDYYPILLNFLRLKGSLIYGKEIDLSLLMHFGFKDYLLGLKI